MNLACARPDGALAVTAAAQVDVLTRAQLARFGIGRDRIASNVRARRWCVIGARVVVLHCGPLSRRQRRWVATLHYGPGAALCGLTGADAGGLHGFETDQVHVIVPKQSMVRHLEMVRLHSELLLAGQVRNRRLLLSVLGDVRDGAQTLGEIDLVAFCRRHRLPQPTRQVLRRDSTGRKRYLDAEWVLPDGRVVVVEIDGAGHLRFDTWLDDMARANELALTGRIVLRIPNLAFRLDEHTVADQLRRALGG